MYKRLTNNNLEEYNPELDFCAGCKYYGEPNGCNRPNGTCDNYERFIETYNRLAELEDKIENGTLIELPCKVGDTIYWISSNNRDIIEVFVKRIALAELDRVILYVEEKGLGEYTIMFVDDIYKTKAEAEAKLKELKNE